MSKALALLLALLAAPLQDKPKEPAQEELPTEMKWDVQKDDRFDFKWTYDEGRKHVPGQGDASETSDKRDVTGEVSFKPNENGEGGTIILTVKKALWAVSTKDYDLTVTYVDGKKADLQVRLKGDFKGDPKVVAQMKEVAKARANSDGENMRKLVEGAFTIVPNFRKNETMICRDGAACKPGPGLFDKIFLHSPLPTGSSKAGQTWRDPVDTSLLPTGIMTEASTIDYKVGTINATTIPVKAGFQVPLLKPPTVTDQKITGLFSIAREYTFHRAGFLQSSKEEVTVTKKVEASGKDAAFYKEDSSASIKQALSIRKRPSASKAEEKK